MNPVRVVEAVSVALAVLVNFVIVNGKVEPFAVPLVNVPALDVNEYVKALLKFVTLTVNPPKALTGELNVGVKPVLFDE